MVMWAFGGYSKRSCECQQTLPLQAIAAAALSEENASMLAPSAALTRTVLSDFTVGLLVYVTSAGPTAAGGPFSRIEDARSFRGASAGKRTIAEQEQNVYILLAAPSRLVPATSQEAERNAGRRRGAKQHHL